MSRGLAYGVGGFLAVVALLAVSFRLMRTTPLGAQAVPVDDAASLYWKAIDITEANNNFFDPPNMIDVSSPAAREAISDFKKAAAMPACKPVAEKGRSLGRFLSGMQEGAMLVDSYVTVDFDKRIDTATTQMQMAEQASKILSGRKTAGTIEMRAILTWWVAVAEEANDPKVLDQAQKWLDQTTQSKDLEWSRMFPAHHMGQVGLNILKYRLSHKGKLPETLKEAGGGLVDPSSRKPYVYQHGHGIFELFSGSKDENFYEVRRSGLYFNGNEIGSEHQMFGGGASGGAKTGKK